MAKIGLNNFRYAKLTEASDGTPSYDGAKKPAKAISCNVNITNNDAKLYADDGLAESDSSFQSGTVSIGLDNDDQETMADLLGHAVSEGEMVRNADDIAPYVGLGRIIVKMVNNVRKYKVEFLHKVKFSEPSQENQTKGENLEFGTYTLEGSVAKLANGDWSKTKTFDTMNAAVTYLEGLMAPSGSAVTVTYNVNGGSGTVAAVSAYVGQRITLDDGSGITPPSNKEFIGWDTTSTSVTADCTSPYTVTGNVTLYAIYKSVE